MFPAGDKRMAQKPLILEKNPKLPHDDENTGRQDPDNEA